MPTPNTCERSTPAPPSTALTRSPPGAGRRSRAPADAAGGEAGPLEHGVDELPREVEARLRRAVDVGRGEVQRQRPAGEVAHGGADVAVAHVEADREGGAGDQRQAHRRAAGAAPAVVGAVVLL